MERAEEDTPYVHFVNLTERIVELILINVLRGTVKYFTLQPESFLEFKTRRHQNWMAFDYHTRDRLLLNKKPVYVAKTTKEEAQTFLRDEEIGAVGEIRFPVTVTIPVYSLKWASLIRCRDLLSYPEDVLELNMPTTLQKELGDLIRLRNHYLREHKIMRVVD